MNPAIVSKLIQKLEAFLLRNSPETANPMDKLCHKIFTFLGLITIFVYTYPTISTVLNGFWSSFLPHLFSIMLILPILYSVLFKIKSWSRMYLLLLCNSTVFFLSAQRSLHPMQFNVLFFSLGIIPFALFSTNEKKQRLVFSSMPLLCFTLAQWISFNFDWNLPMSFPFWNSYANYALCYMVMLACTHLLIQSHDITLAYLDEERTRLINTDKLATLGELSSSLAHEVKNPLAVIISRGSLINERLENGPIPKEDLTKGISVILRTAGRIEKIIKSIQALSRDSTKDELTPIPLSILLDDVSILLDHKIKAKEIDFRVVKHDPLWQVFGRESQLVQVLMNLISNGIDAVENLAEKWVEVEFIRTEKHFMIQVKDSGSGIPIDVAQKIMSPFFTTKVAGKGTGLGLSISQRIMKDHLGELIYVPNTGYTVFQMKFPISSLQTSSRNKEAS